MDLGSSPVWTDKNLPGVFEARFSSHVFVFQVCPERFLGKPCREIEMNAKNVNGFDNWSFG